MNNPGVICYVLEQYGHWLWDEELTNYKIIRKWDPN